MALSGSVGTFGTNRSLDVTAVQRRLAAHGHSPGSIDGRCGRRTVGAILAFQRNFLAEPDGRVDVNGPTWRRLEREAEPGSGPRQSGFAAALASATPKPPAFRPAPAPRAASAAQPSGAEASYRQKVPAPPPSTINVGINCPSSRWMEAKLGRPRQSFTDQCQDMTNAKLRELLEMRRIGHNNFLGLRPALDSLQAVMMEISHRLPDLYPHIGSAGMLCCRNIRGSVTNISNHSWGTAVDIAIDGEVEPMGPGQPYLGLSLIAPIFNARGWYWGGGYAHRKDCMHFECSESLVNSFDLQA